MGNVEDTDYNIVDPEHYIVVGGIGLTRNKKRLSGTQKLVSHCYAGMHLGAPFPSSVIGTTLARIVRSPGSVSG